LPSKEAKAMPVSIEEGSQVWEVQTEDKKGRLKAELDFFDAVTSISGKLYPVPRDERKAAAVKLASEVCT
jgi:uncharacterized protein YpmB